MYFRGVVPNLPTGTVTFLFTDIESSTQHLQALGDSYGQALGEHHEIIRSAIAVGGGVEVGTEGDSFFCVFDSAVAGVLAATAAQRALRSHEWPSDRQIRVRMGLHSGEGRIGADNYVGLDVHRAARIAAAAHGGQILVSAATHALAETPTIGEGLVFRDLGDHRLKDLRQPERLFQVMAPGLAENFPPPASLSTSPQNLPTTLTSFVGRAGDLEAIRALLQQERLVTLTGPGGVGKTRLAIELGRSMVTEFDDGVTYVPLAHVEPGEPVAAAVAHAIGVPEQVDRDIEHTLAAHLTGRAILLILDNCEHLLGQVTPLVDRLLQSSPASKVLTTSRETLGAEGEHVYRVDPLPLPASHPVGSEEILSLDVVRLFVDRARAVSASFDPAGQTEDILSICHKLDGIPLAIELAAARTSTLTAADISDRLDDRLTVLATRSRGAISPHQTLEAAIDWSHGLLTPPEARLFRRLAAFEGGFSAAAAEAICSDGDLPAAEIVDNLGALIDKSLVTMAVAGRRARYALYEPIRRYAAQRLRDSGEWDSLVSRHENYFLAWARARAAELRTEAQLEALDALEAEHKNLSVTLSRSWERGETTLTLDLAATLIWFWYLHGHFSVGELWSDRLLADDSTSSSRSSVRMLIGASEFDYRLGHHDRAESRLRRAIEAARAIDSESLEMWAHSHRATNELLQRNFDEAAGSARASLAIAERQGAIGAAAYAKFILTGIEVEQALSQGTLDPERAVELHSQLEPAAVAARALGDRNMIGHLLQVAGFLSDAAADSEAWQELDASLAAFGELRSPGCGAHCLEMVSLVLVPHDPVASATILSAAESIRATIGIQTPMLEHETRRFAREGTESALGQDALQSAWEAGKGMTLAEAIAFGRESLARAADT